MLYTLLLNIVHALIFIFNGKMKKLNKNKIENDKNYVFIAPHRSILDPVFIAIATKPRKFVIMAKQELFEKPIFNWLFTNLNAFPVNREKPGPSAIKIPVKKLKETDSSLIIFPTGSRHSSDIKGGAITIARMAKVEIVPVVYSGPFTIAEIFKRKNSFVNFGEPFKVERSIEGVEDINEYYGKLIQQNFEELEQEINQIKK